MKLVRCSDGTPYPTALPNWHWEVLDILKEHEWCGLLELEDEAHELYLKRMHEPDTAFQAIFWKIIEWDFETFREIENGYSNQNRETTKSKNLFPEYLHSQVIAPFGLTYDLLRLKK